MADLATAWTPVISCTRQGGSRQGEISLIEVIDYTNSGWQEPALQDTRSRWYCARLEEGQIVFFSATPFDLADEDRDFLIGVRQATAAYHKNISYRPAERRVRGLEHGSADAARLGEILRTYSERVTDFAREFLAPYARGWQLDFASFRSIEERGRELALKSRNDLLHTDAFPTRPTNGNRILRIFTNDLTASAQEIADLYKRRWAIELFFRWVKQTLKIGHFLGTSENAVRTQIIVALIAFLLLRLAHDAHGVVESPLAFARLIRTNLMERRPLDELVRRPSPPRPEPRQASFAFDAYTTRQAHQRRALRARLAMERAA